MFWLLVGFSCLAAAIAATRQISARLRLPGQGAAIRPLEPTYLVYYALMASVAAAVAFLVAFVAAYIALTPYLLVAAPWPSLNAPADLFVSLMYTLIYFVVTAVLMAAFGGYAAIMTYIVLHNCGWLNRCLLVGIGAVFGGVALTVFDTFPVFNGSPGRLAGMISGAGGGHVFAAGMRRRDSARGYEW
jgi:hypothetical protein